MHICVSKLTNIGWDNGLAPNRHQIIIWTNAGILLIGLVETYFSEILNEIDAFSFKKMHLKMRSVKWWPFCLGLNVCKNRCIWDNPKLHRTRTHQTTPRTINNREQISSGVLELVDDNFIDAFHYIWTHLQAIPSCYIRWHSTQRYASLWYSELIGWNELIPWWRNQMEIVSTLLALFAENSPVTGEFPARRPVTRSFDVFFDLSLNKRLSKQSWGWWFETISCSLWRHSNAGGKAPLLFLAAYQKNISPPAVADCQIVPVAPSFIHYQRYLY